MGDANNEVLTTSEVAKLKFDPSLYRVNAYQGLAYDPMRKLLTVALYDPMHKLLTRALLIILCVSCLQGPCL